LLEAVERERKSYINKEQRRASLFRVKKRGARVLKAAKEREREFILAL